ncbi:30S ribosomal protein S4 [Candidatus Woesearchaeota archaeon]|nr:30S ribosomal protein S4 [Candidatus Woesearchaeota archaeon]
MGDPRKPKKQYTKPLHPWNKDRIELEKELTKTYGFKNKKEIWKMNSILHNYTAQAKKSIVATSAQGEIEKKNMIAKLVKLGLIKEGGQIDDILSLTVKDICERRLQTIVSKKNLARSVKQARQFIIHGHINIGDRKVSVPSYLVSVGEEPLICFSQNSELSREDHPERALKEKEAKAAKPK